MEVDEGEKPCWPRVRSMQAPVLGAFHFSYLIDFHCRDSSEGRGCYFHFIGEETESQKLGSWPIRIHAVSGELGWNPGL